MMARPFSKSEFMSRTARVRARMADQGVDLLLVSEPANIYWLTGAGDWSFYVPQFALVMADEEEPRWIGRAMDAPGARLTAWMAPERVHGYPESYIQRAGVHASDHIGEFIASLGFKTKRIGYESDSYYLSPKSFAHLQRALPNSAFVDCDLLVNWARAVKSEAELGYMRQAAAIVETAMRVAYDKIAPGVRQCDAVAEIYKAQIAPNEEFGGDLTSLCPIILAGEMAATAHPMWTDAPFGRDQAVAIELGGSRRRYTSALARTLHLGRSPPQKLVDTAKAVEEGLEAVLAVAKAGMTGSDIHAAWQTVLSRHGLKKDSRIGYAMGIGFPPDWGEHTISLRAGETVAIEPDTTIHIMLGMWMEGWGMEMSETVRIMPTGVECLTSFPRGLHIK
ncbi:MAG: M24 family metallopeptidase [Rhizobiales bacterium]|nr:M24 family metallopeptidase [Hyphomicrobiales bacterium]